MRPGPLSGAEVLVTAEARAGRKLTEALEAAGATAVSMPCIQVRPPEDAAMLHSELARLDQYDWLVVTSRNGAAPLARAAAPPKSLEVAAVGPSTAKALEAARVTVTLIPERATASTLLETMARRELRGQRVLLLQGNIADDRLERGLSELGAMVNRVEAYRTIEGVEDAEVARSLLDRRQPPMVTLMSGSAARALKAAVGQDLFAAQRLICIGPATAAEVRELGAEPARIASPHTTEGLIDALERVHQTDRSQETREGI